MKNLTIFVEEYDSLGKLRGIYIKEKINNIALTLSDPGRGYFYPPPLSKFDAISLWKKVEFLILTLGGFSS